MMATTATTTKKTTAPASESKSSALRVVDDGSKPMEQLRAELATEGVLANALTMKAFSRQVVGELDPTDSTKALRATAKAINGGDLKPAEDMLLAQAATLNAIFCELARRAGLNLGEGLGAAEIYMRMALKAQAQCRATLEALVEAKAPRSLVIAKSANVAHNQQINHGSTARTEEPATSPNGLLEAPQHGNFVDPGAAGAAGRDDPVLAPVGALDGTAHR
jgi:hypothetical protein